MNVVYLVQGALDDLLEIQELIPQNQFLMTLNYETNPDGADLRSNSHIYLPNSTWASGRNTLLKSALQLGIQFDYFIFLDADLRVIKGDFSAFETFLEMYRPKLGLPLADQIKNSYRYIPTSSVQTQFSFDQIMQAYRSDVINEAICVPYVTEFDSESWWYSCEINTYLCILHFQDQILQYNEFEIVNSRHDGPELNKKGVSNYQAGTTLDGLIKCKNYISQNHISPKPYIGTLFHPSSLPGWIYFPSLKQLFRKEFSEALPISLRHLIVASAKSMQLFLFRTLFRRYYIKTTSVLDKYQQ